MVKGVDCFMLVVFGKHEPECKYIMFRLDQTVFLSCAFSCVIFCMILVYDKWETVYFTFC